MSSTDRTSLTKVTPPEKLTTVSPQYDLFTSFLGNAAELSNTIELWDAIPKYAVSARKQVSMRDERGRLPIYKHEFQYRPQGQQPLQMALEIQPALIEVNGTYKDFYPSGQEWLVEEVVRKIFSDQRYGQHEARTLESWVYFTLAAIQKELKARGRSRSLDEIKRSLEIMGKCNIQVTAVDRSKGRKAVYSAPIFSDLVQNGRDSYIADPKSKWAARLPALVSRAVNDVGYRQFNYGASMALPLGLPMWMHKRLSHIYTYADLMKPYNIAYSTIERDSGMLQHSKRDRNIKTVNEMWEALKEQGILMIVKERPTAAGDGDIVYEVVPTTDFISDIKAANKRQSDARRALDAPPQR